MKLTVCFGQVKVIVPCGDGVLTVKELIAKATARYVKASLQENIEVDVKYLQTEEDAILDSDDVIADVCDDKDKLIAIFQAKTTSFPQSYNYQTSTSSKPMAPTNITSSTGSGLASVTGYSTNQIDRIQPVAPPPGFDSEKPPVYHNKNGALPGNLENKSERRSGREWRRDAPRKLNERSQSSNTHSLYSSSASSTPVSSPDATKDSLGFNRFDRNLNRKSLSTAHPLLYSWIDAQERMNEKGNFTSNMQYGNGKRYSDSHDSYSGPSVGDYDDADEISSTSSEEIELEPRLKEDFNLKVQGYRNADGKELGLIVHEIKNDSVIGKHGSLNIADRITEVNGINLRGMTNTKAEAVLNEALAEGPVKLKRTRSHHFIRASLRNVSMEKHMSLPKVPESAILSSKEAPRNKQETKENEIHEVPIEDPKIEALASKSSSGNKILIELTKGATGLGFSITSRDVVTGGQNSVYVKNIMAKGAAITDGRLKVGDQIIEVNDVDVSCKDQAEVVKILKNASGIVKLLVNRQSKDIGDADDNEEAMETVSNDSGISTLKEEFLSMTIPLNDLGPAGLGISVKGRSTEDNIDLGIFVKSIIKGGAAAKDGRLKLDDRLLQINNISLDGLSNDKAMDALRDALKESVKQEAKIKIFVSRKSKSEQSQLVPDGKPEIQASVRPQVPSLELNEATPQDLDSHSSHTRSPKRERPYTEVPKIAKKTSVTRLDIKIKPPSAPESVKFVSVSSSEIPVTQPSKPIMINRTLNEDTQRRQLVEVKATVFPTQKEFFYQNKSSTELPPADETSNWPAAVPYPPSYNETLKRMSTSSSDTGSNRGSQRSFQLKDAPTEQANGKSNLVRKGGYLIDDTLDDTDLIRTMSTSSRFSIDSLMMSPEAMPFSRDAFGRLSMSERKGRAHLDATKSTWYSKLKKSKSLENVHSVNSLNGGLSKGMLGNKLSNATTDSDIVPLHDAIRRTESLDTLLDNSHITSDEEEAFHRNTALSKSTPWYAQRALSPTALKLRSRSTAWNDSFRTAVDRSAVFYTQNGGAVLKPQENAIPIKLTSNANYDTTQQTKKKAGLLKGIGNLLKKGKPRRTESKNENREKESMRPGQGINGSEKLLDFPRRPRPHSMHEEMVNNSRREVSDSIREKERAKREKEDQLVLLQKELNNVQESEYRIKNHLGKKQQQDTGRKALQQNPDARVKKPSLQQFENGSSQQPYKSLLQRGQERILQREKNQYNAMYQYALESKPVVRQESNGFKSKRNLTRDFTETEREVTKDVMVDDGKGRPSHFIDSNVERSKAIRNRQMPGYAPERFSDSNTENSIGNASKSQSDIALELKRDVGGGQQNRSFAEHTRIRSLDSSRTGPEMSAESNNEVEGSKQRYLPETPLFFYGHSSLPRKFTMNNVRKKSSVDSRQQVQNAGQPVKNAGQPTEAAGQRTKQPIRIRDPKISEQDAMKRVPQAFYVGDGKQSSYSLEEQTEAFIRAQQGHELRTSKRTSAQRRNQPQTNAAPTAGTITISHAANI